MSKRMWWAVSAVVVVAVVLLLAVPAAAFGPWAYKRANGVGPTDPPVVAFCESWPEIRSRVCFLPRNDTLWVRDSERDNRWAGAVFRIERGYHRNTRGIQGVCHRKEPARTGWSRCNFDFKERRVIWFAVGGCPKNFRAGYCTRSSDPGAAWAYNSANRTNRGWVKVRVNGRR